ncbi:hypothetical protein Tco_0765247 [Tanacetum coccineum]
MAGGHDLHDNKEDTLLESADLRGIKIVREEMLRTLGTKLKIMGEDLESKRNPKLWYGYCINLKKTDKTRTNTDAGTEEHTKSR